MSVGLRESLLIMTTGSSNCQPRIGTIDSRTRRNMRKPSGLALFWTIADEARGAEDLIDLGNESG